MKNIFPSGTAILDNLFNALSDFVYKVGIGLFGVCFACPNWLTTSALTP
jgi:hypothetical protein